MTNYGDRPALASEKLREIFASRVSTPEQRAAIAGFLSQDTELDVERAKQEALNEALPTSKRRVAVEFLIKVARGEE